MIGLSLAMLPADNFAAAVDLFNDLQQSFGLSACEVSTEPSSPTALAPGKDGALAVASELRKAVSSLGVHLPYEGLNPVSRHPRIAAASREVLLETIDAAASIRAGYVVFHVRGTTSFVQEEAGLTAWSPVVRELAEHARKQGLRFLVENADDLRRVPDLLALAEVADTDICLDIGHLYERLYETDEWGVLRRVTARVQDIASPWPFILTAKLPAAEAGGLTGALSTLDKKTGCIHLHNHDGRLAHQPLSNGHIPWRGFLAKNSERLRTVPIILEADYRAHGHTSLERDLKELTELLAQEKSA